MQLFSNSSNEEQEKVGDRFGGKFLGQVGDGGGKKKKNVGLGHEEKA